MTPLITLYSYKGLAIHKDVVIYFIQMGADFDVVDESQNTLLIRTLSSPDMLRRLAKNGIDINKEGPKGYPLVCLQIYC